MKTVRYNGFNVREETMDKLIVDTVFMHNEYRLPNHLGNIDLVVDIGAHIGAFSKAALHKGARNVVAFEPDRENFDLAVLNLQPYLQQNDIQLINKAVWSESSTNKTALSSHYFTYKGLSNTGSKKIDDSGEGDLVDSLSLDEVLEQWRPTVQSKVLVKLDCEGAEWPILYSSKQLSSIYAICGEYHEEQGNDDTLESANCNREYFAGALEEYLKSHGFECQFTEPSAQGIGLFFAVRNDNG